MPDSKKSSKAADAHLWIQILAGGIGSRFWPASTRGRPKQLLPLASERPLIVDTVQRARSLVPDSRIRILAGPHLTEPFSRVLPELPPDSYLVEPAARGTCPALAWAAWELVRLDPDAVLVSLHSDHLISTVDDFKQTLRRAAHIAATEDLLLAIGVEPTRVETGYGHIRPGEALDDTEPPDAFRIEAFHEKPDAEAAQRYMDGGCLWNTGIFVWKAAVFLEELQRHTPEVASLLPLLEREGPEAFFQAVPVSVVDRAVMERTSRAGTVKATFTWDDVGSWEALARTRPADPRGNVAEGSAAVVDGSGNVVYSEDGEVVLYGVHDLVVVQAAGTTLVMPRERASDLKTLLSELEARSE